METLAPSSRPKTQQILDAIADGHRTITAIANATDIDRRSVNAFVYSLEKQGRVTADSYDVVRAEQAFSVVCMNADPTKGRPRVHPYHKIERSLPSSSKASTSLRGFVTPRPQAPVLLQHAFFRMVSAPTGLHASAAFA